MLIGNSVLAEAADAEVLAEIFRESSERPNAIYSTRLGSTYNVDLICLVAYPLSGESALSTRSPIINSLYQLLVHARTASDLDAIRASAQSIAGFHKIWTDPNRLFDSLDPFIYLCTTDPPDTNLFGFDPFQEGHDRGWYGRNPLRIRPLIAKGRRRAAGLASDFPGVSAIQGSIEALDRLVGDLYDTSAHTSFLTASAILYHLAVRHTRHRNNTAAAACCHRSLELAFLSSGYNSGLLVNNKGRPILKDGSHPRQRGEEVAGYWNVFQSLITNQIFAPSRERQNFLLGLNAARNKFHLTHDLGFVESAEEILESTAACVRKLSFSPKHWNRSLVHASSILDASHVFLSLINNPETLYDRAL